MAAASGQVEHVAADMVRSRDLQAMNAPTYCPNGHAAQAPSGVATCPECAAPLYTVCPNGHRAWLIQRVCPTCGAALGAAARAWTSSSWPMPSVLSQLPVEEQVVVRGALRPGEQLLWCGKPDPAVRFTKADLYLVPFSIMWAAFTVFWEAGVASSGGPIFFVAWGVPFVAMGAYITVGRFIWKARRKRHTVYIFTDQLAVVLAPGKQFAEALGPACRSRSRCTGTAAM